METKITKRIETLQERLYDSKSRVLHKIADQFDYLLYFWPDKDISWKFKVLNFLSADWLRLSLVDISLDIDRLEFYTKDHLEEDEEIPAKLVDTLVKRTRKHIDDFWQM